jgi:hypothetical protein
MIRPGVYTARIIRGGGTRIDGPFTTWHSAEDTARALSGGDPFEIRKIGTAAELKNLKRWKP